MKQTDFGYKFRPVFTVQPFFYSEVPLSVCGRFCSRSDVGLSEGFRSSLSLSNVLFLSVWLFLSLSEQLGHHICPGLGLARSKCTSCWTCVEIGRKCLPFQRDYFSSYWHLLRVWGNCKCCWETDLFHNTVIELCKKKKNTSSKYFWDLHKELWRSMQISSSLLLDLNQFSYSFQGNSWFWMTLSFIASRESYALRTILERQ